MNFERIVAAGFLAVAVAAPFAAVASDRAVSARELERLDHNRVDEETYGREPEARARVYGRDFDRESLYADRAESTSHRPSRDVNSAEASQSGRAPSTKQ